MSIDTTTTVRRPSIEEMRTLHAHSYRSMRTIVKWYAGQRVQPAIAEHLAAVASERGIPLPAHALPRRAA